MFQIFQKKNILAPICQETFLLLESHRPLFYKNVRGIELAKLCLFLSMRFHW